MEITLFRRRRTIGTDAVAPALQEETETGLKASWWVLIAVPLAVAALPAIINNSFGLWLESLKRDNAIAIECAKAAVGPTPPPTAPDFCATYRRAP